MSAKKENTALATQGSGFMTLADTDFSAMVSDELDGFNLSFERVKIPVGGQTAFELPTDGEETEMVKEFSAVILFQHAVNAFYKEKYTGGSQPPDCGALDGKIGKGEPGGVCADCPLNQFGSDESGNGKGCKNKRNLYILREGEMFPLMLTLPTGSLKSFAKYLKTQLSKGRASNSVVTKFSLKKATNSGGIAYSQAVFALDRTLTPEEYAYIKPLTEQMKAYAASAGFELVASEEDEVGIDPETGEIIEPISK